jgi:hypothetical protein
MFNCPDRCFAEVVVESPVRHMDDAVEVRVIVDPRHGGDHSKSGLVCAVGISHSGIAERTTPQRAVCPA